MASAKGAGVHQPTQNSHVVSFVNRIAGITQPDRIFWCDGSEQERDELYREAVATGVLVKANEEKWPGCYFHRSNPNDVARVESLTSICTETREEAGPTNQWADPEEMQRKLYGLLEGSMRGRTLYVIPYLMGPPGSPFARVGIQLTDSIYVVLNMRIMTRMGEAAYRCLGGGDDFNRGIHSMLDCHPDRRHIAHFPQENTIISVGSAYGGNALLGKKCLALRIASFLGRKQGWYAEHMLLLALESPEGEKTYVAAAFPSACGKTNFAMMRPPAEFRGWKITTLGDDIVWMWPGADGRLRAINPEAGYFGVAPGTNAKTNPNAMATISRDTIFTNVGTTPDGDLWWEGKDNPPPANLHDWRGRPWSPQSGEPCAHPNSRFTAPMKNNPVLAGEAEAPEGVPISAIIFGGRRATTLPLVFQAFDWNHGVYLGATLGSETTAAAAGEVGRVRRDPMAMLSFCGYNMSDYFTHWLEMQKRVRHLPQVFHVNWFRKDPEGRFLWPGFDQNMRVLLWIAGRCRGTASARETPLGWMPSYGDLETGGLKMTIEEFEALQHIDPEEWERERIKQELFLLKLSSSLPPELLEQARLFSQRLPAPASSQISGAAAIA